ncbi:unnamed protein product [Closterium sp. NIES-65]|nr:unnamed protein product [Closterium sp. NIES-65]
MSTAHRLLLALFLLTATCQCLSVRCSTGEYHSSSDLHPVYDPCPFTPPTDVRPSNAPSGSGGSGGNAGDGGSGLYIVRLRSAPPLAAYRGAVARFPGGWADDNDDDENNDSAARPAGLMATAKAVAAAVKATAGRIPRRARLSLKNPQIKAYAQMLESQQTRIASEVGVAWNKMVHSYKRISQQGDRTPFPSLPSSPHPPQLQANLTTGRQNTLPFPSLLPPPPAATSESHNRATEHPSLPFPPPPTPRSYKRISQQGDRTPFPSLPSSPHPPQLQANLTTGYKRISQQGDRTPFPSLPSSPHPPQLQANLTTGQQNTLPFPSLLPPPPAATSESHNRATEHPSLPFPPPPTPCSYKRISQQGDRTPFPSLPSSPHPPQLQANLTTGRQNTLPFPSLLPPPPAATSESHNRATEHPSLPFPPPPTPRSYKRISQQGDRTPFPSLPSSPHPPQLQANLTTGYKRISQQGDRAPFPSLPSSPHPLQLQANLTTGRQNTLPFPSLLPPPPAATSESHNRATEHPSLPFPPPPTPRSYKRISQQGDRAPFPSLPSSPHPPQLQAHVQQLLRCSRRRASSCAHLCPSTFPPPPSPLPLPPLPLPLPHPPSYKHTSNGFSAMFTPGKLWRLKRHPAVASVRRSTLKRLLTTDSPTFLVMNTASSGTTRSLWPANGGQAKAGDGMVIAIADSGIWPEHPSFSDKGFSSSGNAHGLDLSADWLSPRDAYGHGTWCAGAAAGNSGVPMAGGTASGMAPAARLVAYKVLWSSSRGGDSRAEEAGIIAAVNQGVADGVDVISLSLGVVNPTDTYFDNIAFLNANLVSPSPLPDPLFSLLGSPDLFSHPTYFDDIAFLNANLAGVVVTFAGGNSGSPGFATRTIDNYAPFYLTVGASASIATHSSHFELVLERTQAGMLALLSSCHPLISPHYHHVPPISPHPNLLPRSPQPPRVSSWPIPPKRPRISLHHSPLLPTPPYSPLLPIPPHSSPLLPIPPLSSPLLPTPLYSSPLLPTPPHSSLFLPSPPHSSPLLPIPPHSSPLLPTPPLSSPLLPTPPHSSLFLPTPPHSSLFLPSPPHSSPLLPTPPYSSPLLPNPPTAPSPGAASFSPAQQTSPSATPSSTNQTSPSATPSSTNQTSPAATPAATPSPGESAPKVADFSSTGPLAFPTAGPSNGHANDCILKPDILGPGVDLYAAAPGTRVGNKGGSNQVSGISMATPHLAGIAALVMQKYPSWSPAQVMSAIMTTATTKDVNGAAISSKRTKIATTPWDMGNGHVFPPKALDPGLTFDAQKSEYLNFLAGLDMKRTWAEYPKEKLTAVPPRDLNRPTISVAPLKGSITVTRTVTSVPDSASTYTAKVEKPQGVEVTVKPSRFTISPGKKVRFVVTFKVTRASEDFQYGSLTWVDEKGHSVRSAIAVKPVGK